MSSKSLLYTAAVALAVTVAYEKYGKGHKAAGPRLGA